MRSLVAAFAGAVALASNVTFFGAPRFSLGDTLPNRDIDGNILIAQDIGSSVEKPSCQGGSSANARSIAYYQEWNTRTRPCDKVQPSQIKLDGLTQLNLAFAYIDPKSYQIRLQNPQDDGIYHEFVGLKDHGLKVWLGVGGWEFSDEGPTRTTWSDMASSSANRKAFITSTLEFLRNYGFQGLDIDWEWPASASRGGRPEDTQNQVTLAKELREALGKDYGLTCVLPHDNTFLEGIDIKALAEHVDWFNVLTYDLHGSWDQSNPAIGAKMRPHTDLKEIDTHLDALWATGVDPGKFTLGLAYYGRGYTAADPNCLHYDCPFSAPSTAGECSTQAGILSGCEIKRNIKNQKLTPTFIEGGAGAMQLTWGDQWISYDNDHTFSLKKDFANERCMGGTAVWAIDYDSCNDNGELPPVGPGHSSSSSGVPSASSVAASSTPPNGLPTKSEDPSTILSSAGSSGLTSTAEPTSPTATSSAAVSKSATGSTANTKPADTSVVTSSVAPSSSATISSSVDIKSSSGSMSGTLPLSPSSNLESTMSTATPPASLTTSSVSSVVLPPSIPPSSGTQSASVTSATVDTTSGISPTLSPSESQTSPKPSGSASTSFSVSFSSSPSGTLVSSGVDTTSLLLTPTSILFSTSTNSNPTASSSTPASLPIPGTMSSSLLTKSNTIISTSPSLSTFSSGPASTVLATDSKISTLSDNISSFSKSVSTSASASASASVSVSAPSPSPSSSFDTSSASSVANSETSTSSKKSSSLSTAVITSKLSISNSATDSVSTIPTLQTQSSTSTVSISSRVSVTSISSVISTSTLGISSSATSVPTIPTLETQSSTSIVSTSSRVSVTSTSSAISTSLVSISSSTAGSLITVPVIPTPGSSTTLETASEASVSSPSRTLITPSLGPAESAISIPTILTPSSATWSGSSSGSTVPLISVCTGDCDLTTSGTLKPTHTGSPDDFDSDEVPIVPWPVFPESDCPPNSARAKAGKNRSFFGCGCGWSGLDYGPGCPRPSCGLFEIDCWIKKVIEFMWFEITLCGHLFECNPCKWVGCPGIDTGCGIFGCDGYCFSLWGCDPDCPPEVCGTCITKGDCPGIKPGPPPGLKNHPTPTKPNPSETPDKTRKPTCGPKEYVTATEVFSFCVKKVLPVSVTVNSTTSTTISTCSGHTSMFKNCPPIAGFTTTEWQTLTETASCTQSSTVYSTFSSCLVGTDSIGGTRTSSCMSTVSPIVGCDVTGGATKTVSTTSKPGGCTRAPLVYNEWEGDNTGLPRNASAMTTAISIPLIEMKPNATSGSCPWSPLQINDDEGDNVQNDTLITIPTISMKNETTGGSCPWIAIDLDDDEGDNFYENSSSISIPVLSMKPTTISIPELTMMPSTTKRKVASHLSHQPITKPPKGPHLSQTAHPTPPSSDSPAPTGAPGPKPIPAGGRWQFKLEHTPPKFHWTLYDDGGNEAGDGEYGTPIQCQGRPLKDCFPFEIQYKLDPKRLDSHFAFEVMLDLPSGRRLKWEDGKLNDLSEDGYPRQNYGCGRDDRWQYFGLKSREIWCYFVWHGQGGWNGQTDQVGY
ncbi:hypothetical protein PMIN07_007522 [Paraphaeosphaeria minitans]